MLPMLASLADAPLDDPASRLRTEVRRHPRDRRDLAEPDPVRLWSRLGNEKTHAVSGDRAALWRSWARPAAQPVVLDGEIVALDADGQPDRLSAAAGTHPPRRAERNPGTPPGSASASRFIAFDLLRDGATDLRDRPLLERRAALERLVRAATKSPRAPHQRDGSRRRPRAVRRGRWQRAGKG